MENFSEELQKALSKKQEWYNSECLQELLSQYRLMHSCVRNLYECFVKKSLIVPDPYRLDKKISSIVVPESSPFAESDIPNIFGERFSNYETMLDYICTYFRFSVENFNLQNVKKLIDFNKISPRRSRCSPRQDLTPRRTPPDRRLGTEPKRQKEKKRPQNDPDQQRN